MNANRTTHGFVCELFFVDAGNAGLHAEGVE